MTLAFVLYVIGALVVVTWLTEEHEPDDRFTWGLFEASVAAVLWPLVAMFAAWFEAPRVARRWRHRRRRRRG